jgi:UDP-glucose 4-epimerase
MDLANGHILALDAIDKPDGIFSECTAESGLYRAFNLGRGKGMSVLDMINAMSKASGFKYEYEIVGRRYV